MENRGECSQEVVKENDSGQEEEKNLKKILFFSFFFSKNFKNKLHALLGHENGALLSLLAHFLTYF